MYIKTLLFLGILFLYPLVSNGTYLSSISLNKYPSRLPSSAASQYYKEAKDYFMQRKRPRRDFIDVGIGATVIESLYPLEMTAFPFYLYFNYRRERAKNFKTPLLFSLQYEMLGRAYQSRIHGLMGLQHPASHDLNLFHVGFMMGFSFPFKTSSREKPGLEFRLLFTHIIGPKASTHRLYLQWGAKAQLTNKFKSGLVVQLGLDNYL